MAQDTRTEETIQEEIRDAEPVKELGIEVVHTGDEDLPLEDPMEARRVSSAGYKYLWDTETKERVPILYYMLAQQLRKKRADGQPRFQSRRPEGEPWRGNVKCMLHKDNPQREYFDSIGFRVCKKSNIQSPHALTQHMRLKHPQEWKHIEDERIKKERLEDRELQRAILSRVVEKGEQGTPEAPLYISNKEPKKKRIVK